MLTVAIIGADGSGKSTVTGLVVDQLDVPARRMYLGVSAASATHPLPTTRLLHQARVSTGQPLPAAGPPDTTSNAGSARSTMGQVRAFGRLANRVSEELYQEAIRRWHQARGRVVVCDRFYLADFHAHDLSDDPSRTWDRRVHGAFLRWCFSAPDLVVLLTAPAEVLYERKHEGSIDSLTRRQAEYASYAQTVTEALVVDATKPIVDIVDLVTSAIHQRLAGQGVAVGSELAGSIR